MSDTLDSALFTTSGRVAQPSARADYGGYIVTVVTATGAINIREAMDSAGAETTSGPVIDTIPAATAAGASKLLPCLLNCNRGIYVEFAGGATGSVRVLYR